MDSQVQQWVEAEKTKTHVQNTNKEEHQPSLQEQLELQQQALAQIYKSIQQMKQYLLWNLIGSLAMIIVPVIVILIILPRIIAQFESALGGVL